MENETNTTATVQIHGEIFVVVPEAEYKKLIAVASQHDDLPELPPADSKGNRPARETIQVVFARKLIRRRRLLNLTQHQLAELSGVRTETISRLESGKHAPNSRTVDRLVEAMDKHEAKAAKKAAGRKRG
jgi:DNA-binding XRE family transcriptional regulator